jgi:SAM-dependent methyltransferase
MLHFAPERSLSKYLRHIDLYDYRTADLQMKNVDERVDITHMPTYNDNSLDCFICSHILEHVPDDTQAMRELFRILKPGGWGIVMTPILPGLGDSYEDFSKTTPEERLDHFGQEDHVRVYAKGDFIRRLESAGFGVIQLGMDFFGADSMRRSGVSEKSCLYVLKKGISDHFSAICGSGLA